jgi:hypothetical protein
MRFACTHKENEAYPWLQVGDCPATVAFLP